MENADLLVVARVDRAGGCLRFDASFRLPGSAIAVSVDITAAVCHSPGL